MNISENWLREWVNPELTTAELCDQVTMAGLEVDGVEPAAAEFSGVIVGEIIEAQQHPDADKLRVCQVAGHADGVQQVVCGAPNARVGLKIPFATVGAVLPPGEDGKPFKIKKAKLRGVESFGMLCGDIELQLGEDDSGLWELPVDAPVGADLRAYLKLDDQVIEIDLTPNRSDCLSVAGIARDIGVLNRVAVTAPEVAAVQATVDDVLAVSLEAGQGCSRYAGRVIRNVDVTRPTPVWMQERLRRAGLRCIDAVVDVTNYVLLELGQPMHAFDLAQLDGGIHVRFASEGEPLALLNGQDIKVKSDSLVIADDKKPLALAGIMGGQGSAVGAETRDIFLESAYFDAVAIAGKARDYGLHTDSSHRFERGVDFQLQEKAIERATGLLLDIVGGEPGPITVVENEHKPAIREVSLRRERILSGLGFAMSDDDVLDILQRLGLEKLNATSDGWSFSVPSYRFDISIEEDLLEELARVYGYNRLPTTSFKGDLSIPMQDETLTGLPALRAQLVARGYQEAITYSFIEPSMAKLFDPDAESVALQNPISAELGVMRRSLWPGLVGALKHNLHRQQTRVRLFESGLRFVSEDGSLDKLVQEPVLAGLCYGARFQESWSHSADAVDFYDLKGDVESLLDLLGNESGFEFKADSIGPLHPGQCAALLKNGETVGYLGALHPQLQKQLGIDKPVYLFEVLQSAISKAVLPSFEPLSRFPEVRRDLALIVDQQVPAAAIGDEIRAAAGNCLTNLKVFDVYVGKGIDANRKSVALGLTYQHPSRTLNEEEINTSVSDVLKALEAKFNATLR